MDEIKDKLPAIKNIVYLLSAIIVVETALLTIMIPDKSTFHWITLTVIFISLIYLLSVCLRLIKAISGSKRK
ncbi:MAG: hypothetical protein LUF90_00650 [Rikenellaceae bacterium]|nr:hypothetical protein [Rikenellaceae bacterium]